MEVEDLYADEKHKLRIAVLNLERFEFTWDSNAEAMKRKFEAAAHEELGKAGFTCHVHWEEFVKRTPLGDIPTGVWQPSLQDVHRTIPVAETDHDRLKHDIVTGKMDGQAGYIREDGSRREDPIKKIIT